jgi:hypothetical protein
MNVYGAWVRIGKKAMGFIRVDDIKKEVQD